MTDGWSRQRQIFLVVSALLVVAVGYWAGSVLLPFLVAAVIAYVQTPIVDWVERKGMARWIAVVLTCVLTLGLTIGTIALGIPRLYREAKELHETLPELGHQVAQEWGPWVEKNASFFSRAPDPGETIKQPEVQIEPLPNGGYGVSLTGPVDLYQRGTKHWELRPREVAKPFEFERWVHGMVESIREYTRQNTQELLRLGTAAVSAASRGILLSFMTLICAAYLVYTRDDIVAFFRSLPPAAARPAFDRYLERLDRGLSGVVRGQLMICAVNGVLSGIGFALFGLKYWPLLALIAGAFSLIPIFGSILSSIPAVMVGLAQDFWTALWVLLWIIGIHQIEASLLNPRIIGSAAKLHPVLVVFVLILGEHTYGLWGALFAVPILSIVQTTFLHFRSELFLEPPDETPYPVGSAALSYYWTPDDKEPSSRRSTAIPISDTDPLKK